jgi:hypothetical protein
MKLINKSNSLNELLPNLRKFGTFINNFENINNNFTSTLLYLSVVQASKYSK